MSKNNAVVPQARAALDNFKMEAAKEVGVNLKQGYNGDLTAKEAGSVGGLLYEPLILSGIIVGNRAIKGSLHMKLLWWCEALFINKIQKAAGDSCRLKCL